MLARSKCLPSSKRSARSSPPLSLARCSIENLPIAENWGAMWAWDRARFAASPVDRDQGISKAGNPTARSMMIELAWTWLRYQPGSALSIGFRERVGNLKGRPRRIAIVAMARKLLVALWRYLQTGLVPTGALLKA